MTPASTDKAINLDVSYDGTPSLDEMQATLEAVASEMGMAFSHITKLGAKRYAGNRHWHLKQDPKKKGCLDVTYWPPGGAMWITMRRNEPDWVTNAGHELGSALERSMTTSEP